MSRCRARDGGGLPEWYLSGNLPGNPPGARGGIRKRAPRRSKRRAPVSFSESLLEEHAASNRALTPASEQDKMENAKALLLLGRVCVTAQSLQSADCIHALVDILNRFTREVVKEQLVATLDDIDGVDQDRQEQAKEDLVEQAISVAQFRNVNFAKMTM